jgi:hypothetical protein
MKFVSSLVYPIIKSIKEPKFIKYDNFWNVYFLNEKLFSDFSFQLKFYNHSCENKKIEYNVSKCCNNDIQLINTDLEIKNKDIIIKELVFTQINENNFQNANIEKYVLEKKNKNDTNFLNIIHSNFDFLKNLHFYMFVSQVDDFLSKNIPGKTLWTNIEKENGLKLYQQIIFYLKSYEKTLILANNLSKLYIINDKNQLVFKFNQKIRLELINNELSYINIENEFIIKKLVGLFKELDFMYD